MAFKEGLVLGLPSNISASFPDKKEKKEKNWENGKNQIMHTHISAPEDFTIFPILFFFLIFVVVTPIYVFLVAIWKHNLHWRFPMLSIFQYEHQILRTYGHMVVKFAKLPYGHEKYIDGSECPSGNHMAGNLTWLPTDVNFVVIWKDT